MVNSRTVELKNNSLATAVGAVTSGVIWEWLTDLRARGEKAVAESLLLGRGRKMEQAGNSMWGWWDRDGLGVMWRNVAFRP